MLAAHCLASADPSIAEQAREGDLLLAGLGFGAGSERDVAALALQAAGFAAIVCATADAEFVAAAGVYGLPVLTSPAAVAAIGAGVVVRIDLARGRIEDRASGACVPSPPCPPEVVDAARRAQLLARMRRVVEEEGYDG